MTKSKKSRHSKMKLHNRVFRATGMSLGRMVLVGIALVGMLVAIAFTMFNEEGGNASSGSRKGDSAVLDEAANRLKKFQEDEKSDEAIYREVSTLGNNFDGKNALEKITLLAEKANLCQGLIESNSVFVDSAKDRLIRIYGFKMTLEDSEGIDSSISSQKLEQLRSQAVQEENKVRSDLADLTIAYGQVRKLETIDTREDFRLAAEALKRIDSSSLRNSTLVTQLRLSATRLFDNLAQKEDITKLLNFMGAKFAQAPDLKVLETGLDLKDYPFFSPYFAKIEARAFNNREKKFALLRDLFTQIEKTPPEGPRTYQTTIFFLDHLLNEKDAQYMGILLDKLAKAATGTPPTLKIKIEKSIARSRRRAAAIGKVADLSGNRADGSALGLPNGKKTVLVFWKTSNAKSMELVESLTTSNRFDIWTTNIAFASSSAYSNREQQLIAAKMSKFILMDRPTSTAMMERFGVDQVPCVIDFAEDGTVLKMGGDFN